MWKWSLRLGSFLKYGDIWKLCGQHDVLEKGKYLSVLLDALCSYHQSHAQDPLFSEDTLSVKFLFYQKDWDLSSITSCGWSKQFYDQTWSEYCLLCFDFVLDMYDNLGAQYGVPISTINPPPNPFGNAFTAAGSGFIRGGLGAYGERILGSSSEYVQSNVSGTFSIFVFPWIDSLSMGP